jgi:ABC-type transport system involved in cytochrome bd biosynthesis fused ATPase/permease subunit
MRPLLHILSLWRGHALGLGLGLAISLASLACGVALMTLSGVTLAAVLAGTAFAAPLLLRASGAGRVVLR